MIKNSATPDQFASGVTSGGERWSVARFGALVVTTVSGASDDELWPDARAARREFADRVAALTD